VRSINSYRPQNQHPDGLVRYHERLAEQHHEQVRVTVQAMHRRKMKSHEITVAAVVKESGVSSATIYRNDELFAIIHHANPNVQRRPGGQVYERTIQQLQEELSKAKAEGSSACKIRRAGSDTAQKDDPRFATSGRMPGGAACPLYMWRACRLLLHLTLKSNPARLPS
jgi:hypothetical protein